MSDLSITAFSSALYASWYLVEPFHLLLDCGDGVCALLGQKSRRIRTIAISHADRDHLTGLLQLNQLNARHGIPAVYYPSHCGSFPALAELAERFDPHVAGRSRWLPIADDESIDFEKDLVLTARANAHKPAAPGETKSVGFDVSRRKSRLRPQFRGRPGGELAALAREHGRDSIHEWVTERLLSYSGDAPVGEPSRWHGTPVLIHECTFLERATAGTERAEHSCLDEVLDMLRQADVGEVILSHFSARYRPEEVVAAVRRAADDQAFPHPIWIVPPALLVADVLGAPPVWRP